MDKKDGKDDLEGALFRAILGIVNSTLISAFASNFTNFAKNITRRCQGDHGICSNPATMAFKIDIWNNEIIHIISHNVHIEDKRKARRIARRIARRSASERKLQQ